VRGEGARLNQQSRAGEGRHKLPSRFKSAHTLQAAPHPTPLPATRGEGAPRVCRAFLPTARSHSGSDHLLAIPRRFDILDWFGWRDRMKFDQLKRREFIALVGGGAAAAAPSLLWPLAARAQQPAQMPRIGVLIGFADDPDSQAWVAGFRQGLEKRGWLPDRNVRIDYRFAAGQADRFSVLAKELIALQPNVILSQGTSVTAAAQQETRTVPIVFVNVSDPIGSGFVPSLARPSGNITGLLQYEAGITGKWLSMLKEIAPQLKRVALIANPKVSAYEYFVRASKAAADSLALQLVASPIENAADIERAIASFARAPDGGLLLTPDSTTLTHRDLVIALAARHRLPAVYPFRVFVTAGGLMAYGTEQADIFRQAASYVDRILRGDKPADLPVQAPTRFETSVNLGTAKALGLTVPPGLLVAADEVIE
jgi:putative ABC transport system substrate-binding protein